MWKMSVYSALSLVLALMAVPSSEAADGRKITIKDIMPAIDAYESGFAKGIMRNGDNTVRLWNRQLIENDAPGAGTSNKGAFMEPVYGDRVIKKLLTVGDTRCDEAHVVLFLFSAGKKLPLVMTLNGSKVTTKVEGPESYLYIPVEPAWLKKGVNEITFACPEAQGRLPAMYFSLHAPMNMYRGVQIPTPGWRLRRGNSINRSTSRAPSAGDS